MKVLVTGASGLLGRAVYSELKQETCWPLVGTALSRARGELQRLNLLDEHKVRSFLNCEQPDAIVHCAAERRPDLCEMDTERTMQLNVGLTGVLADEAAQLGAWLLYLSTDYVFDGSSPPYAPDSAPNPLNFYGRSKLEGELEVRRCLADFCILRVPVLYGQVEYIDESPITIIAREVLNKQQHFNNWAIRYPTHVADVAVVIRQILKRKLTEASFSGTFHWSGDEGFTRYDMARIVAPLLGVDGSRFVPENEPGGGAPRPKDSCLECGSLQKLGIGSRTSFREGIQGVLREWDARGFVVNGV